MGLSTHFGYFRLRGTMVFLEKCRPTEKNIEMQFMNRFSRESIITSRDLPTENADILAPLVKSTCSAYSDRGSLNEVLTIQYVSFLKLASRHCKYNETIGK